MFPNNHSSINSSSSKPLSTTLKASVVLMTAIMLSACGNDNNNSYNLGDIFDGSPTTPTPEPTPTPGSDSDVNKTGVQTLNIDAKALIGQTFVTTTRDFDINSNSLVARADSASSGLLPKVTVTTSSTSDSNATNGFKSHNDNVGIPTSFGELPLSYKSVYKDFGTQMRIGHIDGSAALGETKLPVNGVAVYGNKTLTLPTEGTVAYSGDATYRLIGLDNNIQYGSAEFKADFAAKKVDGNLKFSQAGNIGISGDIVGNEFSGKKGVYSTEGGFYGDDAKYLGGVYSGRGAQGTFGAEKQ